MIPFLLFARPRIPGSPQEPPLKDHFKTTSENTLLGAPGGVGRKEKKKKPRKNHLRLQTKMEWKRPQGWTAVSVRVGGQRSPPPDPHRLSPTSPATSENLGIVLSDPSGTIGFPHFLPEAP